MRRILLVAPAVALALAGCTTGSGEGGGEGGGNRDFDDRRPFPPVSKAVDFWRRVGGLPEPNRRVRALSGDTRCEGTGKGERGVAVTFCRIDGGGHEWPDGAGAMLWDFFASHPDRG